VQLNSKKKIYRPKYFCAKNFCFCRRLFKSVYRLKIIFQAHDLLNFLIPRSTKNTKFRPSKPTRDSHPAIDLFSVMKNYISYRPQPFEIRSNMTNFSSKKNIRYVIGSLAMGGTERHLLQVTKELVTRGWNVSLLTISDDNPLQPVFESNGVKVHCLGLPNISRAVPSPLRKLILLAAAIFKMRRVFVKDSVPTHFFLPHSYIIGMMAKMISGSKSQSFMSRRSLNEYQKKRIGSRQIEKYFHGHVNAIFGNSKAIIEQLKEEGARSEHTHLIYNGIDSGKIAQEQCTKELSVESQVYVYCIGNFIPYKGHFDLIDALGQLLNQTTPTWHVICFGRDDGILSSLKDYAKQKGLGKHISWIEGETEPWRFIRPGHIGVLPSHEEGFSNAILEMMACGLAVVATDVGGNPEALAKDSGIIVPPRNPKNLGQAVLKLLNSSQMRAKYSKSALGRVADTFSIDACIESYEMLYERYLSNDVLAQSEQV
jgi:glycosyltransferase involved in cell wall biosynthesis